jgi:MYXO-CTERM domain-containing protein
MHLPNLNPINLKCSLGLSSLLLATAAATGVYSYATPAAACGGTFCNANPQQQPVDQTGENIVFAFDGDSVEVHIQIAYDPNTDADKFSWIIPMQSLPEFFVGSELLFDNVLNGTVPTYGLNTTTEVCGGNTGALSTGGDPNNDGGLTGTAGSTAGESDSNGGGPEIVYEGRVGAFDITVLSSKDSQELLDWFDANDYNYDASAVPIIEAYLQEGNLFAAFKLVPAETPVVHPVTLRYTGVEPCVPIRLTRVAAVEDMDIRVFFLGDHRAIPTNYRHVLVNPLKIDWPNLAANYKEVVTAAVDAFKADGNAFVTEYAGPSSVISQDGIHSTSWDPKAFVGLPAVEVFDTLLNQGIMECWEWETECIYRHPLLQGLLAQHLPVPEGLTPSEFYSCLSCFEAMIDQTAWGDGSEFATAYEERIVGPGLRAVELLQSKSYVTRMYTTISPHEMMEDPMFAENKDLPEIPRIRTADKLQRCDGHAEYTLPDGREVFVPNDGDWPAFADEMPWEEETQQMAMAGAPQVLNNNTETIDAMLADWNAANRPSYDAGSDSSGDGAEGGCGCTSESSGGGLVFGLGLLGLVGLLRRRR